MTFVDGDLYERSFETPAGRVGVLAEIVVRGQQIELRDVVVYPYGADRLEVAPGELLAWVRLALAEIRADGFAELRVTGTRLSGAGRGRRVDRVIGLRREQP
jgi:hypothetical protein